MSAYLVLSLFAFTQALTFQNPVAERSVDIVERGVQTSSCRWVTTHSGVATCVTTSTSCTKSKQPRPTSTVVPTTKHKSTTVVWMTASVPTHSSKSIMTSKSSLTISRRSSSTTSKKSTYATTTTKGAAGSSTTKSGSSTTARAPNTSSDSGASSTKQSSGTGPNSSRLSTSTNDQGTSARSIGSSTSNAASPSSSSTTIPRTTTMTTLTTTSSSASATAVSTGFKISVQSTAPGRVKRLVLYVQFVGNVAQLTEDASQASTFTIVDGYLMYGDDYVNTDSTNGYASFSTSSIKPTSAGTWSDSGGQVTYSGAQGFCYAADNSLYIITSQSPPFACTSASLVENTIINPSSPSPSSWTIGGSVTKSGYTGSPQYTGTPTTRTTSTTISCTESVYTATSRCQCRWSLRCNSHAVSEFGFEPDTSSATNALDCIEQCNGNVNCGGLYFDPGSGTCYTFDTPGDNVLYGYNTGPWIAASPLDCDESCAVHTTTLITTTASTTSASPTPTGQTCHYEEYQATSGGCDCVWPIKCGTQVDTTPDLQRTLSDHHDCVNLCDLTSQCQLFTYDPTDEQCRIWYDADQPAIAQTGVYWCARLDNWCPASQCPS